MVQVNCCFLVYVVLEFRKLLSTTLMSKKERKKDKAALHALIKYQTIDDMKNIIDLCKAQKY